MRSLIVGASGFLGLRLAAAELAAGHEVVGVARRDPGLAGLRFVPRDLADAEGLAADVRAARPDRVFHLAGRAEEPRDAAAAAALLRANVENTALLGRALAEAGFRGHLVLASSCAVYGRPAADDGKVDESAAIAPVLEYGAGKWAQEELLAYFARRAGFGLCRARLFNLTGPGEPERLVVAAFCARAAARRATGSRAAIRVGDVSTARDFLDVRDAAAAFVSLADARAEGAVNVASGRATPIAEVAAMVCRLAGVDGYEAEPEAARASEVPRIYGDVGRLAGLGFRPRHEMAGSVRAVWAESCARAGLAPGGG